MKIAHFQRELEWFKGNARGASIIPRGQLNSVVFALTSMAEMTGFDFRAEVTKADSWLSVNPRRVPASRWDRFYVNWFKRAKGDGRQRKEDFDAEVKRFG